MNERIKSLLAKAHLDVMEDLGDIDSNHVAEKFADLILDDVLTVIEEHRIKFADNFWHRRTGTNLSPGAEWIANALKSRYNTKDDT
jgi:hypothetical protein